MILGKFDYSAVSFLQGRNIYEINPAMLPRLYQSRTALAVNSDPWSDRIWSGGRLDTKSSVNRYNTASASKLRDTSRARPRVLINDGEHTQSLAVVGPRHDEAFDGAVVIDCRESVPPCPGAKNPAWRDNLAHLRDAFERLLDGLKIGGQILIARGSRQQYQTNQ